MEDNWFSRPTCSIWEGKSSWIPTKIPWESLLKCLLFWAMNHESSRLPFFLLVNSPLFLWKFSYFGGQSHNTRVIFAADVSAFLFSSPGIIHQFWPQRQAPQPRLSAFSRPATAPARPLRWGGSHAQGQLHEQYHGSGPLGKIWTSILRGIVSLVPPNWSIYHFARLEPPPCSCRTTLGVLDAASLAFTCLASGQRFQRALFWA